MIFEKLASLFPRLRSDLNTARYLEDPIKYTKKAAILSILMSLVTILSILIILIIFELSYMIIFPFTIVMILFSFYFLMNKPRFDVLRSERYIESEIVSAVRFLILELRSERSVYNAMLNTSKNFVLVGIYFEEIINEVKLGNTMEKALTDAVEICPSPNLRSVYWQLLNSLQTGTDITESLEVLLNDVVEEQKIKIEEYGRELNALSLFYLMVSIIIPTIGFTILLAVLTFLGFLISLPILIIIWVFLTLIQFFFLKFTANRRPSVEAH